jgi:hypothetical protein
MRGGVDLLQLPDGDLRVAVTDGNPAVSKVTRDVRSDTGLPSGAIPRDQGRRRWGFCPVD